LLDLVFSPDGRTLVTAGQDGSVKLWDVQWRSLVGQLRGHTGWVLDVALSHDGKTLATAGDYYYGDGTIRLWDMARLTPAGTPLEAYAVAMWFSADDRTLTFLNAIGQIKDYDVVRRPALRPPSFDTGATEYGNGEPSPDRSKLVLVNEAGSLMLWDISRRPPRNLRLRARTYQSWGGDPVAFAPDGKTFASASTYTETPGRKYEGTVVLWDAAGRAPRGKPLKFHDEGVSGMAFSPDGQTLAVGGVDGTVRLRNLASRRT
jgi:WD40 repeat protein